MKYNSFIFESYVFNQDSKQLTLSYSFDGSVELKEVFTFDFDFADNIQPDALDRACRLLFFMAGVSYYKAYLPPAIEVKQTSLSADEAAFFGKTYQRGLGEFFFINKLDPTSTINFPISESKLNMLSINSRGLLIGLGGGKDSLVTVELLRHVPDAATWSVGHKEQLAPLVEIIGLPHYFVEREWDKTLLEFNDKGAYNGHIPISAILACVGAVVAVLTGRRDVVVSNESSANEPHLEYMGMPINHQYSKSLEFEKDFQTVLLSNFGESLRYYSALRPLTEIRIAELFAKIGFDKYKDVFSSCNKAYRHDSHHMFWCTTCPKCAFVFLVLTPFIERSQLEQLFHGKNLLLDPELEPTYRQLLGIEGNKPLECVGEIKESRAAMRNAQMQYSELSKYQFDLPEDYDFRALAAHSMPEEIFKLILDN